MLRKVKMWLRGYDVAYVELTLNIDHATSFLYFTCCFSSYENCVRNNIPM